MRRAEKASDLPYHCHSVLSAFSNVPREAGRAVCCQLLSLLASSPLYRPQPAGSGSISQDPQATVPILQRKASPKSVELELFLHLTSTPCPANSTRAYPGHWQEEQCKSWTTDSPSCPNKGSTTLLSGPQQTTDTCTLLYSLHSSLSAPTVMCSHQPPKKGPKVMSGQSCAPERSRAGFVPESSLP